MRIKQNVIFMYAGIDVKLFLVVSTDVSIFYI